MKCQISEVRNFVCLTLRVNFPNKNKSGPGQCDKLLRLSDIDIIMCGEEAMARFDSIKHELRLKLLIAPFGAADGCDGHCYD